MTCEQLPTERLQKICRGESELPIWKANVYRAQFGVDPLPDYGEITPVIHDGKADIPIPVHQPVVGQLRGPSAGRCAGCDTPKKPKVVIPAGPGTELSRLMAAKGLPSCQACKDLAQKMDEWGVAGCRNRQKEIIEDIMPRARDWVAKEHPWASALFPNCVKDIEIRRRVTGYVNEAIQRAKHVDRQSATNDSPRKSQINRARIREHSRLSRGNTDRHVLHAAAMAAEKPVPDEFDPAPVFHLGVHLWPIAGAWRHHVDTWNKIAESITGQCHIGISECSNCGTDSTAMVKEALSPRFNVFTVNNSPEGENPTFRELLNLIPQGHNDVFLYAHGKGMKDGSRTSPAVKKWVEIMNETVMFNHTEIERRLAEGYKCFGSFRIFGKYPLNPRFQWHYAGTFFAVRAKYLAGATGVQNKYGGVEAWPGNNFAASEAWVEFGDNRVMKWHYDASVMCGPDMDKRMQEWRLSRGSR